MILLVKILLLSSIFFGAFSRETHPFRVYWNVPTQACQPYGIRFDLSKLGIIQNSGDQFYGDKVSIFYRPGAFPYFTKSGAAVYGGIPQKADLQKHLSSFKKKVLKQMPSNFSGVAILDFEDYEPSLELAAQIYRHYSYDWAAVRNPGRSKNFIKAYSEKYFNYTSQVLFKALIEEGKALRPGALWGYYHYPYCLNYQAKRPQTCNEVQKASNRAMLDLFSPMGAFYPSIYEFKKGYDAHSRCLMASSRIKEAQKIKVLSKSQAEILPYFWFRYHGEEGYLTKSDVMAGLGISRALGADGAIIWGSSVDVNSLEKCNSLKNYVETILGPIVKNLTSTDPAIVNCRNFTNAVY